MVSYLKVSEGSWGEDELVESSEEGSHEGVGFGDINLSRVVHIEFSPGSWEELSHVLLHLGLRNLLGHKEHLSGSLLASILVEDLLSGGLTSGVGDWDGVVVEDVVENIVLVGTEESGRWGIGGGWWWWLDGDLSHSRGRGDKSGEDSNGSVFHFRIYYYNPLIN